MCRRVKFDSSNLELWSQAKLALIYAYIGLVNMHAHVNWQSVGGCKYMLGSDVTSW